MSSSKRPSPPRRVEERDWRSRDDGEEYGYARNKEADRAWRDRRDSSSRQRRESYHSEDRRSRPSGSASASTSARPPAVKRRSLVLCPTPTTNSRSRSPHEGIAADDRHTSRRASDAREGDLRGQERHGRHDHDSYRRESDHGRARNRSRSRSWERHRRHRRSDDADSSDSDDDSDNHSYRDSKGKTRERSKERRRKHRDDTDSEDSGSDVEDHRRRRREKRRKEEKEDRRRRRERKREKKDRAHKKATAASTASWGKHGIITEHDMHKKLGEFRVWLVEERRLNPDTIGKDKEKREFATFVEDFNTATLPHEKYYDMAKYEIRMNLIKTGQTLPLGADGYDPLADEKAHENVIKARYGPRESELSREEVLELRRIQKERAEIGRMRILGMSVPKEMGVRTKEVDRDVLFPPDYYG